MSAELIEIKARRKTVRHVIDAEYWGKPVGTIIMPGADDRALEHIKVEVPDDPDNPGFAIVKGDDGKRYWVQDDASGTIALDENDNVVVDETDNAKGWEALDSLVAKKSPKTATAKPAAKPAPKSGKPSTPNLKVTGEDAEGFTLIQGADGNTYWYAREDGESYVMDANDQIVAISEDDNAVWSELNDYAKPQHAVDSATGNKRTLTAREKNQGWHNDGNNSIVRNDGKYEAVRFSKADGAGFTGWVVRSTTARDEYSDPVSSRAEALDLLVNWEKHSQMTPEPTQKAPKATTGQASTPKAPEPAKTPLPPLPVPVPPTGKRPLSKWSPGEVDATASQVFDRLNKADVAVARDIDTLHRDAGDRMIGSSARDRRWGMTNQEAFDKVKRIASVDKSYVGVSAKKHLDEYRKHVAEQKSLRDELKTYDDEFDRRGGWNRSFVVTNDNGHIHKNMQCSTCRPTTQFAWLPPLSGMDESTIIAYAGSDACTVCYPSAPVDAPGRSIFSGDEEAERARLEQVRAEREAKAAEKDAKSIAMPDGKPLKDADGYPVSTERSAEIKAVQALTDDAFYGYSHPSRDQWRKYVDRAITALAAKRGTSEDEQRALIYDKAKAKGWEEDGHKTVRDFDSADWDYSSLRNSDITREMDEGKITLSPKIRKNGDVYGYDWRVEMHDGTVYDGSSVIPSPDVAASRALDQYEAHLDVPEPEKPSVQKDSEIPAQDTGNASNYSVIEDRNAVTTAGKFTLTDATGNVVGRAKTKKAAQALSDFLDGTTPRETTGFSDTIGTDHTEILIGDRVDYKGWGGEVRLTDTNLSATVIGTNGTNIVTLGDDGYVRTHLVDTIGVQRRDGRPGYESNAYKDHEPQPGETWQNWRKTTTDDYEVRPQVDHSLKVNQNPDGTWRWSTDAGNRPDGTNRHAEGTERNLARAQARAQEVYDAFQAEIESPSPHPDPDIASAPESAPAPYASIRLTPGQEEELGYAWEDSQNPDAEKWRVEDGRLVADDKAGLIAALSEIAERQDINQGNAEDNGDRKARALAKSLGDLQKRVEEHLGKKGNDTAPEDRTPPDVQVQDVRETDEVVPSRSPEEADILTEREVRSEPSIDMSPDEDDDEEIDVPAPSANEPFHVRGTGVVSADFGVTYKDDGSSITLDGNTKATKEIFKPVSIGGKKFRWDRDNFKWVFKGTESQRRDMFDALQKAFQQETDKGEDLSIPFPPTQQQQDIIDAIDTGEDVVVRALAGTGKTYTLQMVAKMMRKKNPKRRIIYVAFNKSIQTEAEGKMPRNTECRTGDSLSIQWYSMDRFSKKRTNDHLKNFDDIATAMNVRAGITHGDEQMSPGDLARIAFKTVDSWCKGDKDKMSEWNVPEEYRDIAPMILGIAEKIWADIKDDNGKIYLDFSHVTKMWALSRPDFRSTTSGVTVAPDVIFFDEAQDINPVMAKVIRDQKIQKVYVGDGNQAIYGFRGAVDQLDRVDAQHDLPLTQSWRFGPEVAGMGNRFLSYLGAKHRVEGGGPSGAILDVGTMTRPDAILVRTNSGAVTEILQAQQDGLIVGVPAGVKTDLDVLIKTISWFQTGKFKPTRLHDDLAGFKSWDEIVKVAQKGDDPKISMYVRLVQQNDLFTLRQMVKELVETDKVPKRRVDLPNGRWKMEPIPEAERPVPDLIVTTAHKAKGLEWDRVKIGMDFKGPKDDPETGETGTVAPEEVRLAYVAVTRAKKELDPGSLSWIYQYTTDADTRPDSVSIPRTNVPETPLPGRVTSTQRMAVAKKTPMTPQEMAQGFRKVDADTLQSATTGAIARRVDGEWVVAYPDGTQTTVRTRKDAVEALQFDTAQGVVPPFSGSPEPGKPLTLRKSKDGAWSGDNGQDVLSDDYRSVTIRKEGKEWVVRIFGRSHLWSGTNVVSEESADTLALAKAMAVSAFQKMDDGKQPQDALREALQEVYEADVAKTVDTYDQRVAPQAQQLINAIRRFGISRRDFKVTTETHRIKDETSGLRYKEYGDANVTFFSREAEDIIADHAEEIAAQNITISVFTSRSGRRHVLMSSKYNRTGKVDRYWSDEEGKLTTDPSKAAGPETNAIPASDTVIGQGATFTPLDITYDVNDLESMRAAYTATQRALREQNISAVTVYRGTPDPGLDIFDTVDVPLFDSWSLDADTAVESAGDTGMVMKATVPASRVAAISGNEVRLLAGQVEVEAADPDHVGDLSQYGNPNVVNKPATLGQERPQNAPGSPVEPALVPEDPISLFGSEIEDSLTDILSLEAEESRLDWTHDSMWPTAYFEEAQNDEQYQDALHANLRRMGFTDPVVVRRRGAVVGPIANGSLVPDWRGKLTEDENRRVYEFTVPLDDIIGIGHPEEGEVFFRTDSVVMQKVESNHEDVGVVQDFTDERIPNAMRAVANARERVYSGEGDDQENRDAFSDAYWDRRNALKDYANEKGIVTPDDIVTPLDFAAWGATVGFDFNYGDREISTDALQEIARAVDSTLSALPWMREQRPLGGRSGTWGFTGVDVGPISGMIPKVQDFAAGTWAITTNVGGLSLTDELSGPRIFVTANHPEGGTGMMGEIGYTICQTAYQAMLHEMGHAVVSSHPRGSQVVKAAAERIRAEVWQSGRYSTLRLMMKDLGLYAGENTDEFLAELFAAVSDPDVMAQVKTQAGRDRILRFAKMMNDDLGEKVFPV